VLIKWKCKDEERVQPLYSHGPNVWARGRIPGEPVPVKSDLKGLTSAKYLEAFKLILKKDKLC
jgi:hypothetical protein